ncbi:MAG: 16S rRNA (guanine(527)-N(7))-methyltransferase RsmG [Solirubrobacteraceae bacterium]
MKPHRTSVASLSARYDLVAPADRRLQALADLLSEDDAAPTTIRDPRRVLDDHLADSLVALELPEVRAATRIADLGSGAGLPGLPLAIALPAASVALLESHGRKCEYLRRACTECEVLNAEVVQARVEEWSGGAERCDLVVARALAPLAVVAEYAAPLLHLGGALVAWRGRRDPHEEAAAARAADELGLEAHDPVAVTPYPGVMHRYLHVLVKLGPTPPRFPRRPGIARKRPLGADTSDRVQR